VISDDGLKIFSDPSFRILLVTKCTDPVLLQHTLGIEKAKALLACHTNVIRKNLAAHGGSEVEYGGTGFIISFTSAAKAVACALAIQNEIQEADAGFLNVRIGINGGTPVTNSDQLFGDTVQLARQLCTIANDCRIAVVSAVKELVSKDHFQNPDHTILTLSPQDEAVLELLFAKLEANCQDADFGVTDYCQAMAMSKSQLYRKTIELCGLSPNALLKEFRLEKAKELMNKQRYSISEITFDAGFTSPSYFTKCFKKKYGLLPMAYLDLLH
jgi:AraC-like DNA-binding protein